MHQFKKMRTKYILLLSVLVAANVFAQEPKIKFKAPVFYPEGTVYDAVSQSFFVGSVKTGTIAKVTKTGTFQTFYQDSTLKSSFGMKLDKMNNLWICTGDPNYSVYSTPETYRKIIHLIALDKTNGKKLKDIDLTNLYQGEHFANDLAFDDAGNIYITDSYSPVIYKVDAAGKASVFAENKLFKGADIGLNGIAYFSDGYLLVANNSTGSILKVDIKNPNNVTKVMVKQFFPGADGLMITDNGKLALVQNKGVDNIFILSSTDAWKTAKVEAASSPEDHFQYPSTCTMADGKIYIVNAKLNEITDPSKKPSEEFSIQKLEPKPVK